MSGAPEFPYKAKPGQLPSPELFEAMRERCQAAGLRHDEYLTEMGRSVFRLELKKNPERPIEYIYDEEVHAWLETPFDRAYFLGDLLGYYDPQNGVISAIIESRPTGGRFPYYLMGAQTLAPEPETDESSAGEWRPFKRHETPSKHAWRLRLSGGLPLCLSSVSEVLDTFYPNNNLSGAELRIEHIEGMDAASAERLLRTVSDSLDFDFLLLYGTGLGLRTLRKYGAVNLTKPTPNPPSYPKNEYLPDVLSYYRYGVSARSSRLPLLEYLAYYQVLEYFFPHYANGEVHQRLREILADPRLQPANMQTLQRIVDLFGRYGRNNLREADQMRLTVRRLVDEEDLRAWLSEDHRKSHFVKRGSQMIRGVRVIRLEGGQMGLTDQVADRLYEIRCRIVHAKSEYKEEASDPILPSSAEAAALGPDIDLLRMVAEKAIIANSKPFSGGR